MRGGVQDACRSSQRDATVSISPAQWRQRAVALQTDTCALYLAARDPRVAWYAKAVTGLTVAYALSPVDLIPDFVPVLGYLDDLVLVPLGLALAIRCIPADLLAEHRAEAARRFSAAGPRSRAGAVLVGGIWLLTALWAGWMFWPWLTR